MKIEVGDYIRGEGDGLIRKIEGIGKYRDLGTYYICDGDTMRFLDVEVTKHSKNIVDLLEVGDIVVFPDTPHDHYFYMFSDEMIQATKEDVRNGSRIKSILTHEQYEKNCFRLEERE